MSTIKDVATLANVSIATVSRVLNSTDPVSPELELRVHDAVAKLGYQPNTLARSLRRNESATLGVLIPDSMNPFFAELAKGIETAAFERGFNVVMCNTDEKADKAIVHLDTLTKQRVAGFIVVSPRKMEAPLQRLLDQHFPIVLADRPVPSLETSSVVADHYIGAKQAAQHLLEFGHRRIGVIVGERDLETIKSRWAGFKDALQEAGVPLLSDMVYGDGDYLPASGHAGAAVLLGQTAPPTAIFAFNDLMALGVLHFAHAHGWSVPEQLSVIGFDDIAISAFAVPGLTTVNQPKFELGRQAANLLMQWIDAEQVAPVHLVLPTSLVVRASTGRP